MYPICVMCISVFFFFTFYILYSLSSSFSYTYMWCSVMFMLSVCVCVCPSRDFILWILCLDSWFQPNLFFSLSLFKSPLSASHFSFLFFPCKRRVPSSCSCSSSSSYLLLVSYIIWEKTMVLYFVYKTQRCFFSLYLLWWILGGKIHMVFYILCLCHFTSCHAVDVVVVVVYNKIPRILFFILCKRFEFWVLTSFYKNNKWSTLSP